MKTINWCCVCGKKATHIHMSFIGQIPFHVCKLHYETTGMVLGDDFQESQPILNGQPIQCNRMGLKDKNGWVDLKYFSKNKS